MGKTLKRAIRVSCPGVLNALIMIPFSSIAAGNYYDARNDAMGGTGVASSTFGSAALANPALLTKAQPGDEVSVIIPSVGIQVTDKDKLVDKVDDISSAVDGYRGLADNFSFADYPKLQAASGDLAKRLDDIRGNKSSGTAGVAVVVAVPNEVLPFAFVTKAYGSVHLATDVSQGDIDYLQGVADGTLFPLPGDQDRLTSAGLGRAAVVTDTGIAVAHQFDIAGHPVSLGVTPKLQKTWLYNYSVSVYDYNKSDFTNSRYKNSNTGFNLDAGLATDIDDNWTFGLSAQNLIPRNIDTKEIAGYRDTWQIRPLVTSGLAWNSEKLTTSLDVDLTPTKRFKTQEDSQYAGVGAEYRLLDWLQLRAGYRADIKSNDVNVATAGLGLSPFNHSAHLDLAGSVGNDNTWGAMAQLGFSF